MNEALELMGDPPPSPLPSLTKREEKLIRFAEAYGIGADRLVEILKSRTRTPLQNFMVEHMETAHRIFGRDPENDAEFIAGYRGANL